MSDKINVCSVFAPRRKIIDCIIQQIQQNNEKLIFCRKTIHVRPSLKVCSFYYCYKLVEHSSHYIVCFKRLRRTQPLQSCTFLAILKNLFILNLFWLSIKSFLKIQYLVQHSVSKKEIKTFFILETVPKCIQKEVPGKQHFVFVLGHCKFHYELKSIYVW